ncbi:MAG: aspartate aminotransferase family protein [Nitrososphaeria archaeon]
MTLEFDEIKSIEDAHLVHTYQKFPVAIVKGEGCRLYDVNGKEYLDYMSGYGVAILGYSNKKVIDAVKEQVEKLSILHSSIYSEQRALFLRRLMSVTPTGLNVAYLANSGTEAIEAALKVALKNTKRKKVIAMKGAYHGKTLGALSLTFSEKYRSSFQDVVYKGVDFSEYGDLSDLEKGRNLDEFAAIFVEPIQGEGGIKIPPDGFLKGLREVADKHSMLLVVDEVQSGLGRTGKMWAHQHWNVEPDVMTIGKGIGGGIPMAATIGRAEYMNSLELGEHTSTTGGNPIACAAGRAVLDVLVEGRVIENARTSGASLIRALNEKVSSLRVVREVRGKGLMIAVDLKVRFQEILLKAVELGLLTLYSGRTVLRLLPPLIIGESEVLNGSSIIRDSLIWYEKQHI